jgi:hypothetical protein
MLRSLRDGGLIALALLCTGLLVASASSGADVSGGVPCDGGSKGLTCPGSNCGKSDKQYGSKCKKKTATEGESAWLCDYGSPCGKEQAFPPKGGCTSP